VVTVKNTRNNMIEEIDFLCTDNDDTLRERKEICSRLRLFDPSDLEFILELCDRAYTQGKNL
jgi:hypothetical protein